MRLKDREVTNMDEIFDILNRCNTIRIAMQGDRFPYVVPVSFGLEKVQGKIVVYFHCGAQGLKVECLKANPHVCVESDLCHCVEPAGHGFTARYESVIGFGVCTLLTDHEEILHGLTQLMDHYGFHDYPLEQCAKLPSLRVGRIVLDEVTGKRNLA